MGTHFLLLFCYSYLLTLGPPKVSNKRWVFIFCYSSFCYSEDPEKGVTKKSNKRWVLIFCYSPVTLFCYSHVTLL